MKNRVKYVLMNSSATSMCSII